MPIGLFICPFCNEPYEGDFYKHTCDTTTEEETVEKNTNNKTDDEQEQSGR